MNPQEFPLFRALSVRLQGPGADDVMQLLINDEKLHARLCAADLEAWPKLANAVAKASAIHARKAIDALLNNNGIHSSDPIGDDALTVSRACFISGLITESDVASIKSELKKITEALNGSGD